MVRIHRNKHGIQCSDEFNSGIVTGNRRGLWFTRSTSRIREELKNSEEGKSQKPYEISQLKREKLAIRRGNYLSLQLPY